MKKIIVLGDGAWGTAFAQLLAINKHPTTLWCYNKNIATEINNSKINSKYLPNISLSPLITATENLLDAINNANLIFVAIPVKFLRSIITNYKNNINPKQDWIILSKGIENNSLLLPSQIIEEILNFTPNLSVISGPSFAIDLSQQQPTCINIAGNNNLLNQELYYLLKNNFFFPSIINDYKTMQLCAAYKNIIAIAIGILEGLNYKDNTKAYITTKAIQELKQLIILSNANPEILLEACGIGDILLTINSKTSRNFRAGILLGQNII